MAEIVKSRVALCFMAAALVGLAARAIVDAVAWAGLTAESALASHSLITAADWLAVTAMGLVVIGLGAVAWTMAVRGQWRATGETSVATLAVLLLAVGALLEATRAPGSGGDNVLTAIGFGVGAALCLVVGARESLDGRSTGPTDGPMWVCAGVGLVLVAIGAGLPNPSVNDGGLALATGLLVGVGALLVTLAVLMAEHTERLSDVPALVAGLLLLAAGFVADGVAGAVVLRAPLSVTSLRVGLSLPQAIMAVASLVLLGAVWFQLRTVWYVRYPTEATGPFAQRSPWQSPPGPAHGWQTPGVAFCTQCGQPAPVGGRFCPYCGAPLVSPVPPPEATPMPQQPPPPGARPSPPTPPEPAAPGA